MASSARIDELQQRFDENPRRYFAALANEYRKAGQIEQAIAICREQLPKQPGHMSGHIVYGQALYAAGDLGGARSTFSTALGLDPENLIALRHMGDIERRGGDVGEARRWYTRLLDADPGNVEVSDLLEGLAAAPGVAPALAAEPAFSPAGADDALVTAAPAAGDEFDRLLLHPEEFDPGSTPSAEAAAINAGLAEVPRLADGDVSMDDALFAGPHGFPTIDEALAANPRTDELPVLAIDPPFAIEADQARDDSLLTATVSDTLVAESAPLIERSGHAESTNAESATAEASETRWLSNWAEPTIVGARADDATTAGDEALPSIDAFVYDEPPIEAFAYDDEPAALPGIETFAYDEPSIDDFAYDGEPALLPVGAAAASPAPDSAAEQAGARGIDVALDALEPAAAAPATADVAAAPAAETAGVAAPLELPPAAAVDAAAPGVEHAETPSESLPAVSAPVADAGSPFVTETMAELYLRQGFRDEALGVYRQLLAADPHNEHVAARVRALEAGGDEEPADVAAEPAVEAPVAAVTPPHGDVLGDVVAEPSAEGAPAPSVAAPQTARAYFAALATRRLGRAAPTDAGQADREPERAAWAEDVESGAESRAEPPTQPMAAELTPAAPALGGAGFAVAELDAFVTGNGGGTAVDEVPPQPVASNGAVGATDLLMIEAYAFDADRDSAADERAAPASAVAVDPGAGIDEAFAFGSAASGAASDGSTAVEEAESLDALFGYAPVSAHDAAAAVALSNAFAGGAGDAASEPLLGVAADAAPPGATDAGAASAGRPTRPATTELSLDEIFRGAPSGDAQEAAPPRRPTPSAFSFDQFFSDEAPAGGADAAASDSAPLRPGEESASDLEQFNSWLESLKRK